MKQLPLNCISNTTLFYSILLLVKMYIFSAIEELKGISRVAVLTEDQEIEVKEYFNVPQHEFKKLDYKKRLLKVLEINFIFDIIMKSIQFD